MNAGLLFDLQARAGKPITARIPSITLKISTAITLIDDASVLRRWSGGAHLHRASRVHIDTHWQKPLQDGSVGAQVKRRLGSGELGGMAIRSSEQAGSQQRGGPEELIGQVRIDRPAAFHELRYLPRRVLTHRFGGLASLAEGGKARNGIFKFRANEDKRTGRRRRWQGKIFRRAGNPLLAQGEERR